MKFAPIVPIAEQGELCVGDLHLLLTHLRRTPLYTTFYQARRKRGDYLIVDNSAYEIGESIDWRTVVRFAEDIDAQEIVLPDVMRDSVETYERTAAAIKSTPRRFSVMAVPQGESKREWEWCLSKCLEVISDGKCPPVVGLSKIYEKWTGGRYELLTILDKLHQTDGIDVHLLGYASPNQVEVFQRDFPWVRSIDSAKPVVAALSHIEFSSRREFQILDMKLPKRPDDFFELVLTKPQRDIAKSNIAMIQNIAAGIMTLF